MCSLTMSCCFVRSVKRVEAWCYLIFAVEFLFGEHQKLVVIPMEFWMLTIVIE